jgi:hypothetical protein
MKFREVVQRVRNPSGQSRARQAGSQPCARGQRCPLAMRRHAKARADPACALRTAASAAGRGQGARDLRLSGLHVAMAANPARQLGAELQDPEGAVPEGQSGSQRLLSAPPTRAGQRATRLALQAHQRAHQLLRRKRQLGQRGAARKSGGAHLVPVATTPESAHAPELAAFWGHPQSIPAATPEHQSAALGKAHVRRPGGRAGWWKSPCPAPVGARGGQLPRATRPHATR